MWKVETRVESDWFLRYDELLSSFAFNFNLRPDSEGALSIAAGWFASFAASMAPGQAWPFNEHPKVEAWWAHYILLSKLEKKCMRTAALSTQRPWCEDGGNAVGVCQQDPNYLCLHTNCDTHAFFGDDYITSQHLMFGEFALRWVRSDVWTQMRQHVRATFAAGPIRAFLFIS